VLAALEVETLGVEECFQKVGVCGRFGARVPRGIDLNELCVPAWFEYAKDLGDGSLPLWFGEGEDEKALVNEVELGGPVRGEIGRGPDREVEVGGFVCVEREQAGFDVDSVELDRWREKGLTVS